MPYICKFYQKNTYKIGEFTNKIKLFGKLFKNFLSKISPLKIITLPLYHKRLLGIVFR